MKIKFIYGPASYFDDITKECLDPLSLTTLTKKHDQEIRKFRLVPDESINIVDKNKKEEDDSHKKIKFNYVIGNANEYAGITESGINNLVPILKEFDIDNLILQNPPTSIKKQLNNQYENIDEIYYEYKNIDEEDLIKISKEFDNTIIGQNKVKKELVPHLYDLFKNYNEGKPKIIMFYGPSGVGKTETAKFLATTLEEKLFRKQFSMYQNGKYIDYIFGSDHEKNSLAKDLLNRDSNVILFDEFDKIDNIFYSAFYQFFDEGVFKDLNYEVNLKDSIVICTSNFRSKEEIVKALGEPICSRFDAFIEFDYLDDGHKKHLIKRKIEEFVNQLDEDDKNILDNIKYKTQIENYAFNSKNIREIDKKIRNFVLTLIIRSKYDF